MNLSDTITSLMSKNVKSIQVNDTLLQVKHFFEAKDFHHHLPVLDGDKVVGMVSLYDFLITKKAATPNDEDPNLYLCAGKRFYAHPFKKCF